MTKNDFWRLISESNTELTGRKAGDLFRSFIDGAKCVWVKSRAESVDSICVQTCRGCKYGLIAIERMKRVASDFERYSHVEDID